MHTRKLIIPISKIKCRKPAPNLSSQIKIDLVLDRDRSVLVDNDNFFLSVPSIELQELVTCTFFRFIISIVVYGDRACDFLTCKRSGI